VCAQMLQVLKPMVTDEEVGGRDGTLHQLEQGVTGDFVVIGEQSGLRLVTESKGIFNAVLFTYSQLIAESEIVFMRVRLPRVQLLTGVALDATTCRDA